MERVFILLTLLFNVGTAVLAVWVFVMLVSGYTIVSDSNNLIELGISIAILLLTLVILIIQAKKTFTNK